MAKKGVLNLKKKRFVSEYLVDLNGTQAAIRAGYSKRTAKQISQSLLKKPEIKKYIEDEVNKITNENIASAVEVLTYFTKVMRGEARASVLALDDKKQILIQKPPDHKEMLEAGKYLAKFHQLFTEKINIEGTTSIVFNGEMELKD